MRVFINAQLNSMQSNPKISAETTMKQLQELMPGARRALFAKYHIGGCQSCGFDDSETKEKFAKEMKTFQLMMFSNIYPQAQNMIKKFKSIQMT